MLSEPLPRGSGSPRVRFAASLIRPLLTVALVAVTAVQLLHRPLVAPALTAVLFAGVSVLALSTLFPWSALSQRWQLVLSCAYVVSAAVLLPLGESTFAPTFVFLASAVAGLQLASHRTAVVVAAVGVVTCVTALWVVGQLSPVSPAWPWWMTPVAGIPVYMGIAGRDGRDALFSAERAAAAAKRASESEAREAALVERARIAREIHDVLGHSLSGIAIQLDMADALARGGRGDEANLATRRARALAVGSITETRRAIQALREDTLPLAETLRLMAAGEDIPFAVTGEPGPVTVETAHAVIRAAQEALTNSVKYAPGGRRAMELDFTGARVSLTVTNGPGESPGPAGISGGTGVGLIGMGERASLLGGALRAGPSGDGGWTVELEVPK